VRYKVLREARKETRSPEKLQVLISKATDLLRIEPASTENVSLHGMRVLTERFWKRDTHLIVKSFDNELWGRGRVVYCQSLSNKTFAVGLELHARTGDWIMRRGEFHANLAGA
jgi:hypothetical protein